jgi:hypothetical protein
MRVPIELSLWRKARRVVSRRVAVGMHSVDKLGTPFGGER